MKVQTRTIALLATMWFATVITNAQVTIGSSQAPNADALLELTQGISTSKGLLLPRVALTSTANAAPLSAHVQGMHVYNTNTAGAAAVAVTPGEYYNDGTKWVRVNAPLWFYAPAMTMDLSVSTPQTLDLWQEYHSHFDGAGSRVIKSTGAPNQPKRTFASDELYYYVTGYDATVFSGLSITADGKLSYTVNPAAVTDATFINIIFVVK